MAISPCEHGLAEAKMAQTLVNTVDGRIFVYFENPPKKGDWIFFLHGYPDSHETFSYQYDYLKGKYGLLAIDLPGVGQSEPPSSRAGYHIENLLPRLNQVISAIAGEETKLHFVGHDWGAMILWVYICHPLFSKRVKSFTAISGPHPAMARQNLIDKLGSLEPTKMAEAIRQTLMSGYIFFFQTPFLPEFVWEAAPSFVWKNTLRRGGLPSYDPMYELPEEKIKAQAIQPINLYRELLQGMPVDLPRRIELPVQLIIPNHDFAISPQIYDNVTNFVTYLTVQSLEANHWVHRERPDAVNRFLESFIAKNN
ncbi:MAG: alpha/beta fold hydrolase [Leptospiraceae bacterium]|nr:alpha/beta fold hydrolase [Leptospiraceae bacterium]MDW8305921.1 alpha/beta fold hydrolase [Leptospiraceae bacterium]